MSRVFKERDIGQRRLPNVPLQSLVDASKAAAASVHDKNTYKYNNQTSSHSRARPIELLVAESPLPHIEAPVPSVQPPSVAHNTEMLFITPSLPKRQASSHIHPNRPNAMSVTDSAPAPTTMCSALPLTIRKRKLDEGPGADSPSTKDDEYWDERRRTNKDHPLPSSSTTGLDSPMELDQKSLKEDWEPRRRRSRGRGGKGKRIPIFMSDDQTHHALAQRSSQAETDN